MKKCRLSIASPPSKTCLILIVAVSAFSSSPRSTNKAHGETLARQHSMDLNRKIILIFKHRYNRMTDWDQTNPHHLYLIISLCIDFSSDIPAPASPARSDQPLQQKPAVLQKQATNVIRFSIRFHLFVREWDNTFKHRFDCSCESLTFLLSLGTISPSHVVYIFCLSFSYSLSHASMKNNSIDSPIHVNLWLQQILFDWASFPHIAL